jgi:hypothetical protein
VTRDDIIRMAREAGWEQGTARDDCGDCSHFDLQHFAALVAAAEREECAEVAEQTLCMKFYANTKVSSGIAVTGYAAACAIRKRGNHDDT